MGNSVGKIQCSAIIFRALLRSTDIDDNGIATNAFIPRRSGADDEGLSVNIAKSSVQDALGLQIESSNFAATLNKPRGAKGVLSLHVGKIRDIVFEGESALDVIRDPGPNNPDHGLITGIPLISQDDNIRKIEKIAGDLARLSRMIYER